ncbi:MAG: hypothetical protein M3P30_07390 [Chloroflexota bacterium]|nr:hypothetical protein [Chloroflexota bacterium]
MRLLRRSLEPRLWRSAGALSLLLSLAAAVSLVIIGPAAEAKRADQIPPTFAGLKSATTCIPGPIGGGSTSSYNLSWDPATDNVSRSNKIVYDVYQADTPKGEAFATPAYTTPAGATSFTTPPLPTDQNFYFVVRSRDQAGNSDSNTAEREGRNLCV